ncbi:phenylacetate--CoA ligase family protein [Kiloniella sp. EL199]|uniref:phenylacetate--CoA ligase family protein n=1 Tax=Kiloniella sp. EL199 TaxID=2107581 RepID=UPI000EA35BA9|nr:AMP-binding protein [Kiloniella sp. EL199]
MDFNDDHFNGEKDILKNSNWLNRYQITSAMPHLEFPKLGTPTNMAVISALTQMENSQWWSADEIKEVQFTQLYQLIRHAIKTVPYYKELNVPKNAEDLQRIWHDIPILERGNIVGKSDDLVSLHPPRSHGKINTQYTSGSTGQPIGVKNTQLSRIFWRAFTTRDHIWHERDPNWKLGHIRVAKKGTAEYPGTVGQGWGALKGKNALIETGPIAGLNINTRVEDQAEWLVRNDPDFLITYPSVIQKLAEYCSKNKIQPSNLKQVETISEVLTDKVRKLVYRAFGVKIVDLYSTRELGYLGLQCPENNHYHVQSEGVYLEVVDDEGKPCPIGVPGKIVVTPLHNFVMPLVRYAVGDYGVMGESCSCGRGLPVLKSILGRERNRLRQPDGQYRWIAISAKEYGELLEIAPIREYQIIQVSFEKLELNVAVYGELSEQQFQKLSIWAKKALSFEGEVVVNCYADLERAANGKLELFKSLVE